MNQQKEQDERIAAAMKQYASGIEARMVAPAPGRVWRKAEAYRKEMALRRAMRSLLVMWVLAGVYVVAMLVWCMRSYLHSPEGRAAMAGVAPMAGGIVLATGFLLVAGAAGAWCLVREGRRETLPI